MPSCLPAPPRRHGTRSRTPEASRNSPRPLGRPAHLRSPPFTTCFSRRATSRRKDRLFQIDLWRRVGTGKLAEVLGPSAIERDKLARAVNYRGDWNAEWAAYGPETKEIVTAFIEGINAYIKGLAGKWPRGVPRGRIRSRNLGAGGLPQPRRRTDDDAQPDAARSRMPPISSDTESKPRRQMTAASNRPCRMRIPQGSTSRAITSDILRGVSRGHRAGATDHRAGQQQLGGRWNHDRDRPSDARQRSAPAGAAAVAAQDRALVGPGWNAIGAGSRGCRGSRSGTTRPSRSASPSSASTSRISTWRRSTPRTRRSIVIAARGRSSRPSGRSSPVKGRADESHHAALHRARSRDLRGSPRGIARTCCDGSGASRAPRGTWPALRWRVPADWQEFRAAMDALQGALGEPGVCRHEGQHRLAGGRHHADPRRLERAAAGPGRRGPIRMEGLPQVRRAAVRVQSAAALHRHRQPQHPAGRLRASRWATTGGRCRSASIASARC